MKYLVLFLISSCTFGPKIIHAGIKTPLLYNELVLIHHSFYGDICCKTEEKFSETNYGFYCNKYSIYLDNYPVFEDSITRGCKWN